MRFLAIFLIFATIPSNSTAVGEPIADAQEPGADSAPPEAAAIASPDDFQFTVMDAFTITSDAIDVLITGKVERGSVSVGDTLCLHSAKAGKLAVAVVGIEMFNKVLDVATAGDMVGIGVTGVDDKNVSKGDILSKKCGR
jgi:translation elongation factor EF-Tu-like GTPase